MRPNCIRLNLFLRKISRDTNIAWTLLRTFSPTLQSLRINKSPIEIRITSVGWDIFCIWRRWQPLSKRIWFLEKSISWRLQYPFWRRIGILRGYLRSSSWHIIFLPTALFLIFSLLWVEAALIAIESFPLLERWLRSHVFLSKHQLTARVAYALIWRDIIWITIEIAHFPGTGKCILVIGLWIFRIISRLLSEARVRKWIAVFWKVTSFHRLIRGLTQMIVVLLWIWWFMRGLWMQGGRPERT